MRKWIRKLLPPAIVLGAIIIVGFMVAMNAGKRPEIRAEVAPAILVDAIEARSESLNFIVRSQGTVRSTINTSLIAEVSGKVVEVSPKFVVGGFFRKGEVLLQIDPSDYETALKRAEAALASRQARLADEAARSEQALKDWQNLGRSGQPSDLVLRKPQLLDAQANVSAAEADVEKARRDLQRTRITIPYDGLVTSKTADLGQFVAPGTQLGASIAVETAEVRLPLSRDDLAYLRMPTIAGNPEIQPVPVTLSAGEGGMLRSWQARIIRTEGVVDESSRVVYAVAEVIDPYGLLGQSTQEELKIGTFVSAEIQGIRAENIVVLPRFVLQDDSTLLVANADNKLEVRSVTLARTDPDFIYVSAGVEGGERIITTTLQAPIPGTLLNVDNTTSAPAAPDVIETGVATSGSSGGD